MCNVEGSSMVPSVTSVHVTAKKAIWETFLQKVPTEVKISNEEMNDLSRRDINGRQIRRTQLAGGVTSIPQLTDITV